MTENRHMSTETSIYATDAHECGVEFTTNLLPPYLLKYFTNYMHKR